MGASISKNRNGCCLQDKNAKEKHNERKRQKNNDPQDPNVSFINKYKIMRKIGDGSFSKVYCCRGENKKKFAMKMMCCPVKQTSHYNFFRRELYIMKTLNNDHPYIVKMLDYEEKIWKKYYVVKIVLEFCEGGNIFEYVKMNGTCTYSDARVIIMKLTKAIQFINSLRIMHRDIKPENILLRTENNVRSVVLSDFGLAKITMPNQTVIKSRSVCGSDFYLSPEIIQKKEYGVKIDIWSLGVLVYFIVVGRVPFIAKNANELYNNILKANIPELLSKVDVLNKHEGLKDLLEHMLVHDPYKRYGCEEILSHRFIRGTISSYEFRMFSSSFVRNKMNDEKRKNGVESATTATTTRNHNNNGSNGIGKDSEQIEDQGKKKEKGKKKEEEIN